MDVAGELLRRQVVLLPEVSTLREQFGDVVADQVRAEQFAVLGVGDQLHEAARVTDALSLAVGREGETSRPSARPQTRAPVPRCSRSSRSAAGRTSPGNHHVVEHLRLGPGDGLGCDHAHRFSGVRQHQLGRDVTDREDVGTFVRQNMSTSIAPRSVRATPVCSRP